MASTQLSPGVVVLERDLTTVANATLDNVAVIVGSFEKGPVNSIVDITSEKELLAVFGRPNDYNYEYWYSAAQFLLYGGTLKVIRADASALKNAIDTAQTQVTLFSASDTTLTVASSADIAQNDLLLIDAEILKVTAINGADLSVLRAQLSTAATSHAASSAITLIEDAGTASTINEGGTLTAGDTTITVASAATLAVQVNDYLLVEDEIVRCTGISGNDLTVERGALSTTGAAHTDGVAIKRLTVTASKTSINESTATGVTAPLIRNVEQYESSVEGAANSWKFGARHPGIYGNSLRIVATDAGPDQILSLAQPTSAEWQFDSTSTVAYSLGNSSASVYSYSVVATLDPSSIAGDFNKDEYWRAETNANSPSAIDVLGQVVAYDPITRKLELSIDYAQSSDVLEVGDAIALWTAASGGSRTGDKAVVSSIERQLRTVRSPGTELFESNYTLDDDNATDIQVLSVRSDYEERYFGGNQKWINVAPRPTTSPWVSDRGGSHDQMHILILDGDGKLTGTPGAVLEKFLFVSKASDARGVQGETVYYRDVLKNNSTYVYWGAHETASLMDVDSGANGAIGLSGVSRRFDVFKQQAAIKTNETSTGREIIGTTNNATIRYSLQGGVDGYTLSRSEILGSYDLVNDKETIDVDYILMGPSMAETK